MSVLYSWSGCSQITRNGQDFISCAGGRIFKSTRERWWFIAISRCDQSSGVSPFVFYIDIIISLVYKLHFIVFNNFGGAHT
jgi:hypothetical protein